MSIGNAQPAEEGKDILSQAQAHLQARRPAAAVRLLEGLVEREPRNALAHQELAVALAAAARFAPAGQAARRALELDPTLAKPHSVLAWIALNTGRFDEAAAEYRACLAAIPETERAERAAVYNKLAMVDFRRKEYRPAADTLMHALELDPQNAAYHFNLAMLYRQVGQTQDCQEQLERTLSLPEVPETIAHAARFNLGHLYARQGRYDPAREQFAQALTLRKTFLGKLFRRFPFLARFELPTLVLYLAFAILVLVAIVLVMFWR